MLFGETVAVYCENRTEYTYTVWAEYRVCTSQETHYISTTKPNRLILLGETVTVYCENHMEHTNRLCGQNAGF
jgi:translation initiation factor IF-1